MSDILAPAPPIPGLQLVITLAPEGSLNLQGPLDQPLTIYGMLEMAKDAYRQHLQQRQEGQRIQPVSLAPTPGFPFGRK